MIDPSEALDYAHRIKAAVDRALTESAEIQALREELEQRGYCLHLGFQGDLVSGDFPADQMNFSCSGMPAPANPTREPTDRDKRFLKSLKIDPDH
jgi:hypothetical protein